MSREAGANRWDGSFTVSEPSDQFVSPRRENALRMASAVRSGCWAEERLWDCEIVRLWDWTLAEMPEGERVTVMVGEGSELPCMVVLRDEQGRELLRRRMEGRELTFPGCGAVR